MQKLQVEHNVEGIIFRGTKQDCIHFIKCRKYNRNEIKITSVTPDPIDWETISLKPTEVEYKKPTLFQRIFKK